LKAGPASQEGPILKATQTPRGPLHVPDASLDGRLLLVFLVHGIRHVDPTGVRVAGLRAGHPLFVTAEDDTPVNSLAVLVSDRPAVTRNTSLGCVPDSMPPLARPDARTMWQFQGVLLARCHRVTAITARAGAPTAAHGGCWTT
jgi:hypothetical protein